MPTGNAPNGFTDDALAAALEQGTNDAVRIINAGRPANPHTPQANVGTDGLSKP